MGWGIGFTAAPLAAVLVGISLVITFMASPASPASANPVAMSTSASSTPTPSPTPTPTPTPTPPRTPTALPIGVGDTGPLVTKVQQRLVWIGLLAKSTGTFDAATLKAVQAFRDKWGFTDDRTVTVGVFKRLDALTHTHGHLPKSCTIEKKSLCVDLTQRVLRLVESGRPILTTDARFGTPDNPTLQGTFHVYRKDANHVSSQYLTPMPYAMFFHAGEAIHYSQYFHADGYYGASHGCVNLRDMAIAKRLFHVTPVGTTVVIYAS